MITTRVEGGIGDDVIARQIYPFPSHQPCEVNPKLWPLPRPAAASVSADKPYIDTLLLTHRPIRHKMHAAT